MADLVDGERDQFVIMKIRRALSTGISAPFGGTLDCGTAQTYPTNGIASKIDVPGGGAHYDVYTTLTFAKS